MTLLTTLIITFAVLLTVIAGIATLWIAVANKNRDEAVAWLRAGGWVRVAAATRESASPTAA